MERFETPKGACSVSSHLAADLLQILFGRVQVFRCGTFAEKFVGITDHFLLDRFGQQVSRRQRKRTGQDFIAREARAGMTCRDACMTRQPLGLEKESACRTMRDIREFSVALYRWSVRHKNSDIVEHRCLEYKISVGLEFGMPVQTAQGLFGYCLRMFYEYFPQEGGIGIIFVY